MVALFRALGAEVTQGSGSRIQVVLNGRRHTFHEPHPVKELGKKAVEDVRDFLEDAGHSGFGMMTYKGYSGAAEIAFDTGMIYGRVVGLRDVITFQGHTVEEAARAFRESVDDYLDLCASRGEAPEKPFSGKFLVRVGPALHRALVEAAAARGVSLNALVASTLAEAFPAPAPAKRARAAGPTPSKPKPKAKRPAARRRPAAPSPR